MVCEQRLGGYNCAEQRWDVVLKRLTAVMSSGGVCTNIGNDSEKYFLPVFHSREMRIVHLRHYVRVGAYDDDDDK